MFLRSRTRGAPGMLIEEVKGGRSKIEPVVDQLDDADLQEFVNKKLNRPINFSYRAVNTAEGSIAVVTIPRQERPFHLKKDFANLRANTVYVRRGSSTDIASLDEVARMGRFHEQKDASLDLSFVSGVDGGNLGRNISIRCHRLRYDENEIPLYGVANSPFRAPLSFADNRSFYLEYAEYERKRAAVQGVRFSIRNTGNTLLKNLRLKAEFDISEWLLATDNDDFPDEPMRRSPVLGPILPHFHSPLVPRRSLAVVRENNLVKIKGEMLDIQPKDAEVSADQIYFGGTDSGLLSFNVSVFADNLPNPFEFAFTVSVEVETAQLDIESMISRLERSNA